jgi:hypothetical protein
VSYHNRVYKPRRAALPSLLCVAATVAGCTDQGPECTDTLTITASIAEFFATESFDVAAVWSGSGDGCPTSFSWVATSPLSFVGVTTGQRLTVVAPQAGQGSLTVRAGSGDAHTATRQFTIGRITGDLDFEVLGLAAGISPDIDLTGPNNFSRKITSAGLVSDLAPGQYRWKLNKVTAGPLGHRWGPGEAVQGDVDVFRNFRFKQTVKYVRETAQLDFEAVNVPAGVAGLFARITRPGFSVDIMNSRQSVAVDIGSYQYETFEVDTAGFRFIPDVFTGTQLVGAGVDIPLPVPFSATRGFLILETPGLPAGASVMGALRTPTSSINLVLPSEGYVPAGTYSLDVGQLTEWLNAGAGQIELYVPIPATSTVEIPGGRASRISTLMHLANWRASFSANIAVLSDPGQNAGPIGFAPTISMGAVVATTSPPASTRTIAVTASAPWVTVAGPLQPDSSFVAIGTGVVASFPNVPVTFTGRLLSNGGLTGTLQMGSDTIPRGIPSGPVRYSVTAARVAPTSPPPGPGHNIIR